MAIDSPVMSMDTWRDLVGNLGTWKRGEERAVHKPLLTLIVFARAQQGGSNEVPYTEIAGVMSDALKNFGPPRKSYHPEYPFWYLQNDGFWSVRSGGDLPRRTGKDQPTHSALVGYNAVGVVPRPLWDQLTRRRTTIPSLCRAILEEFWPDTYHDDIAAFLGLDLSASAASAKSRRDPAFRENVLVAYERRCAVCGFDGRIGDLLVGLEAAHVKFKEQGGPDVVENGLALCSLHHKIFDRGGIGLDRDLRVSVSSRLVGQQIVADVVTHFNGRRLTGPQKGSPPPDGAFIEWHQEHVFQGPARAI